MHMKKEICLAIVLTGCSLVAVADDAKWRRQDMPWHAKEHAKVVRQAEKDLAIAIETGDAIGLQKYVVNPVMRSFNQWGDSCDEFYPPGPGDAWEKRGACFECQHSATNLRNYAFTFKKIDSIDNRREREFMLDAYKKGLVACTKVRP